MAKSPVADGLDLAPALAGEEPTLVRRLRLGDADAVGEAYDLHHGAVRAMARRLVGDDAAAEDVVHDAFLALPRAIRRFRGEAALRTLLISIALNLGRHHVRAVARRRAALERLGPGPAVDVDSLESGVLARSLWRALDALPWRHRAVFVLCDVEQYQSNEAATVLGISEGTVRSRLHHARRKLRAALGEEESP